MNLYDRQNKVTVTIDEIRQKHSDKSLPEVLNENHLDYLGYSPVLPGTKPKYDPVNQDCILDKVVKDKTGKYVEVYRVITKIDNRS